MSSTKEKTYKILVGDKLYSEEETLSETRKKAKSLLKIHEVEGHLKGDVVIQKIETITTILNVYSVDVLEF